jgi:serine kinase of HPr protein (carbohydrate metabolism regulator)
MNTSISARELFDQLQQTLALRWLAGKSGKDVRTDRNEVTSKRPSLAGYLNVIHPNKVQVLGLAELAWLDRLDAPWSSAKDRPARPTCNKPAKTPKSPCGCPTDAVLNA